jgi:hypothetical protein
MSKGLNNHQVIRRYGLRGMEKFGRIGHQEHLKITKKIPLLQATSEIFSGDRPFLGNHFTLNTLQGPGSDKEKCMKVLAKTVCRC